MARATTTPASNNNNSNNNNRLTSEASAAAVIHTHITSAGLLAVAVPQALDHGVGEAAVAGVLVRVAPVGDLVVGPDVEAGLGQGGLPLVAAGRRSLPAVGPRLQGLADNAVMHNQRNCLLLCYQRPLLV